MDIRRVFEGILKKWGHDVLLQRRINTDNSLEKEFSTRLERHTTRNRLPGVVGIEEENLEGEFANADLIYYFKWNVNPREGDRIYENYERGLNDVVLFEVTYAHPMRGRGGNINYWAVGAQRVVSE